MKKQFVLDEDNILWSWHGARIGSRKKLTRASASADTSSWRLTLTHEPTGVAVQGEIPMGHYSNRQMQAHKQKLRDELHEQLRQAVAKHLRLPGR